MKDTDKVTLTIGQLKKLVKETKFQKRIIKESRERVRITVPSFSRDKDEVFEMMKAFRRYGITARYDEVDYAEAYWVLIGPKDAMGNAVYHIYDFSDIEDFHNSLKEQLDMETLSQKDYDILMSGKID